MAVHAWTIQTIKDGDPQILAMLKNLKQEAALTEQDAILFHASPCESLGMHGNYLREEADAEEAFLCLDRSLAFFGHTHLPTVFQQTSKELPFDNVKRITPKPGEIIELDLDDGKKAMVNPGSVGQPRAASLRPAMPCTTRPARWSSTGWNTRSKRCKTLS